MPVAPRVAAIQQWAMTRIKGGSADETVGHSWLFQGALAMLTLATYIPILRNQPTVFDGPAPEWAGTIGFRIVNLLLHLLVALSVFGVGRRLLPGTFTAFTAAVLFAVHPVHVDTLARAGVRGELIFSLAVLAGMWVILRRLDGRHAWVVAGGGILGFAAWQMAAIYLEAAQVDFVANPLVSSDLSVRLMTGVHLIARSLGLMLWPYRLSPDYSYNSLPVVADPGSVAFILSITTVAGLALLAALRSGSEPLYPLTYFWCVTAIVVAISPWAPRGPFMAEHFLYFPSVAFCWALAQLFYDAGWMARFDRRNVKSAKPLIVIVIFLVLPWSAKTFIRTGQWRTERTVLEAAARVVPDNARIQMLLGDYHFREGTLLAAERRYRRALGIYPDYSAAQQKLDATLKLLGR
jgi:hypothetical protein